MSNVGIFFSTFAVLKLKIIMTRLTDRIYYVGVNDTDKVLFEGLWPLPLGVSYNSYVVADEKVALIDTVECGFEEEFLDNIHAADALAMELEELGVPYAIHDLAGNNAGELGISGALRDVFKYDTIVVGAPTYNNGIFPPAETFMKSLQSRLIKGRRFYAFGSYTWAGASVRLLNEMASSMNFEILGDGLSFPQAYTREKVDMKSVAQLLF